MRDRLFSHLAAAAEARIDRRLWAIWIIGVDCSLAITESGLQPGSLPRARKSSLANRGSLASPDNPAPSDRSRSFFRHYVDGLSGAPEESFQALQVLLCPPRVTLTLLSACTNLR